MIPSSGPAARRRTICGRPGVLLWSCPGVGPLRNQPDPRVPAAAIPLAWRRGCALTRWGERRGAVGRQGIDGPSPVAPRPPAEPQARHPAGLAAAGDRAVTADEDVTRGAVVVAAVAVGARPRHVRR